MARVAGDCGLRLACRCCGWSYMVLQSLAAARILATAMYTVNYNLAQSMTKVRVVSVRMSEAMYAKLVQLAAKDRRPLSQFMELAFEDYLKARGEWDDSSETS